VTRDREGQRINRKHRPVTGLEGVEDELTRLRQELSETQERLDFTETDVWRSASRIRSGSHGPLNAGYITYGKKPDHLGRRKAEVFPHQRAGCLKPAEARKSSFNAPPPTDWPHLVIQLVDAFRTVAGPHASTSPMQAAEALTKRPSRPDLGGGAGRVGLGVD